MNITDKAKEIINEYCAIVGETTISVSDYIQIRQQASVELQMVSTNKKITTPNEFHTPQSTENINKKISVAETPPIIAPEEDTSTTQTKKTIPMRPKKSVASIMRTFDS